MQLADELSGVHHPQRRCRTCAYILDHLPQSRCPECGRPFDPADPATYRAHDPGARRRADIQMAALATVTALLFITVPWLACQQLRLIDPLWLAVLAGGTAAIFTFAVASVFHWRPSLLALITVAPACLLVTIEAWGHHQFGSLLAAVLGPALAAALRAGLTRPVD